MASLTQFRRLSQTCLIAFDITVHALVNHVTNGSILVHIQSTACVIFSEIVSQFFTTKITSNHNRAITAHIGFAAKKVIATQTAFTAVTIAPNHHITDGSISPIVPRVATNHAIASAQIPIIVTSF